MWRRVDLVDISLPLPLASGGHIAVDYLGVVRRVGNSLVITGIIGYVSMIQIIKEEILSF